MTKEQFGEFVVTVVIDGFGEALLGWWLETWSGGYQVREGSCRMVVGI
jgi:hypothetical protein